MFFLHFLLHKLIIKLINVSFLSKFPLRDDSTKIHVRRSPFTQLLRASEFSFYFPRVDKDLARSGQVKWAGHLPSDGILPTLQKPSPNRVKHRS